MRIIKTTDRNFRKIFKGIIKREASTDENVVQTVQEILREVRAEGDAALIRLTEKFDKNTKASNNLEISSRQIRESLHKITKQQRATLTLAYNRIKKFHRTQLQHSWIQTEKSGEILGQIVRPLQKVGMYVPGGKAVYPSSVLMNAIPAKVAGVGEVIMVTPGTARGVSPLILAAAALCGVDRVFQIGGAQAIAALAYGTASIPKVDKIVGPGNIYVATAKRLVYGDADIDMVAGPSEILILSDGTGPPSFTAADMLSQAEHDEMALSILITTKERFAYQVAKELRVQLSGIKRKEIALQSLQRQGTIIIAENMQKAVTLANEVAPEHLVLAVEKPWDLLPEIDNAGAVFLGHYTPEAVGDYLAGPNHVLPTGGTARFFSALSVDDFLKKISLVSFSASALQAVGKEVMRFAKMEVLDAHAKAVEKRLKML
jgi:histidinol dehydrogenase